MKRTAISLCLAMAALSVQAESIYSCKDASGRPYYTSQPPTDRNITCKAMAKSIQPSDDAPAARQSLSERLMADRKERQQAQEATAKAEKDSAAAADKAQQCERAKASLAGLESGQIRFTTGPDGERVALEGEVRDRELANAQKAVDSWCK